MLITTNSLLLPLLLLVAIPSAFSQQIISPEVNLDGQVTFRLKAPHAKEVKVNCEGVREHSMQNDGQGI
jgi:hypothetical protein